MEWPQVVHISEIQSRLINDGFPIERAMKATSEIGPLQNGARYRLEHNGKDLYFYAHGNGYYHVADE
jgi:hypothetical protein